MVVEGDLRQIDLSQRLTGCRSTPDPTKKSPAGKRCAHSVISAECPAKSVALGSHLIEESGYQYLERAGHLVATIPTKTVHVNVLHVALSLCILPLAAKLMKISAAVAAPKRSTHVRQLRLAQVTLRRMTGACVCIW